MFRFRGGNPTRPSHSRSWRLLRGTALAGTVAAATVFGVSVAGHAAAMPPPAPVGVYHVRSHGHVYRVETHGRHGVVPMRTGAAATHHAKAAAGNLQYGGGPVEHHVKVYLVFWGSQWDSDSNGVQQYMENIFGGLGTSQDSWSTVTSQYTDNCGQGPSFGGAVLARHMGRRLLERRPRHPPRPTSLPRRARAATLRRLRHRHPDRRHEPQRHLP